MTKRFFTIRAFDSRKSPQAESFGPLPEMPFFERMEAFRESMEQYWKVNPELPGMQIAAVGTEWSDLILCCNSPPSFFISQRIIDSLEREGIPIYRKTAMPIAKIKSKRLRELEPPIYYVLEAIPSMAVDFPAMDVTTDQNGRPVWTSRQKLNPPPFVFDMDSWNGNDLFSLTNCSGPILLLCTERVKQLAEKEKWTNIDFEPIGQPTPEA